METTEQQLRIDPQVAGHRVELISRWYEWFLDHTESWGQDTAGDLGMQLAYLFGAMAKGTWIDCQETSPIVALLRSAGDADSVTPRPVPTTDLIWRHIRLVDEEGEPVQQQ